MLTSLRGKLLLILLAITVSAVTISTGLAHYTQKSFARQHAKFRESEDLRLMSSEIQVMLQWVIRDLFTLRDFISTSGLIETSASHSKTVALEDIENFFLSIASQHQIFQQIRFLDAKGMELVRVNYDGQQVVLVPESGLQFKGTRYYFKEAVTLHEGEIYISPLDLNVEEGVIERPFVPVIRYATPVFDSHGKTQGMVVLNVHGTTLLRVLSRQQEQVGEHGKNYYLTNSRGEYLFHPDKSKEFGFMLGNDERLNLDEPGLMSWMNGSDKDAEIWTSVQSGKATLFAFQRIPLWSGPLKNVFFRGNGSVASSPPNSDNEGFDPHWVLLSAMDESHFYAGTEEYTNTFFLFTLFLFAACVLVAFVISGSISRPVVSLAAAAKSIQKGDFSARAEVYTTDEMGDFGNLFNSMAAKLEKTVSSLITSEAKYRHLFENSRDCVFVADSSCRLIDINKAGKELLGLPNDSNELPVHLPLSCCSNNDDHPTMIHEDIILRGYVQDYEAILYRLDGSERICMVTATTRCEKDGTVIGYEGVLRDITHKRKRQEAERIFHQKLQEEIIMAEERERHTLGQILHEELAQNLAWVQMKIQETEAEIQNLDLPQQMQDGDDGIRQNLVQSQGLLTKMIRQIRTMIFDLYPVMLKDQGLLPTMQWYGDNFTERTGIPVFIYELEQQPNLSQSQTIYFYRAFKELLHNAWKHAESKEIVVTLVGRDYGVRLIVDDEGKGFDVQKTLANPRKIKGIGLFTLKEWFEGLGGVVSVESQMGKGTRVIIEMPLQVGSDREQ